ncbi:MAG: DNA-3-methyladenine glycosylase [Bacteroidetes bacterium]|nr:DNA-3-methyladenine glycosylase [Bacteroidota bacterium]
MDSNTLNSPIQPLPRSFYVRSTLTVAKELLGKYFIRIHGNQLLVGRIVEVEAYRMDDPASHSYRGRTRRNDVMFWEGGHLYVYFTYGMHYCANVVTNNEGCGEAVLIRAVEPILGINHMVENRFPRNRILSEATLYNVTNGPAKFCQAFGITITENGYDLTNSPITICQPWSVHPFSIGSSTRIGIKQGKEKKWRFFIKKNRWLSQ